MHVYSQIFYIQRPNVGEYHIHKLRHKPLKAGNAGGVGVAEVGGASSLEDIPAAYSHPSHSLPPAMDSDNDSLPKPHQSGAEPVGGKHMTDSDPLSDDSVGVAPPSSLGKKCVAINTEQVEHFTHRLLPVQSPEFDNVMDQVYMYVLYFVKFSCYYRKVNLCTLWSLQIIL